MIFSVLGLGESVNEFINDGSITIGVNDIGKFHKVDYIVCVDRINAFTVERLKTIMKSKPNRFFSHLDEWKRIMPTFELIEFSKGRGNLNDVDNTIAYSNNSVFVAIVMAYRLGASEINIYGADFNTHPNFNGNMLSAALDDFKKLFDFLKDKGIKITVTKSSKLIECLRLNIFQQD